MGSSINSSIDSSIDSSVGSSSYSLETNNLKKKPLTSNLKESVASNVVKPSVPQLKTTENLTEDEQKQKDAMVAMDTIAKYIYKYYFKNQQNDKLQDPISALQKASVRISDNIQKINKQNVSEPMQTAAQAMQTTAPSAPPMPVTTPSAPPMPTGTQPVVHGEVSVI